MTEHQWITATDPEALLEYLDRVVGVEPRRSRLFACACVRLICSRLPDFALLAVEASEAYADRRIDVETLRRRNSACRPEDYLDEYSIRAVQFATNPYSTSMPGAAWQAASAACNELDMRTRFDFWREMRRRQVGLVQEVFGWPFRPLKSLAVTTLEIKAMAEAAYDDRNPESGALSNDRLSVLADALEEAGCAEERLLRHLRRDEVCPSCLNPPSGPLLLCKRCGGEGWITLRGPHVRGCWALDLLKGEKP